MFSTIRSPRIPVLAMMLCLGGMTISSGCASFDIPFFDKTPHASTRNPVVQMVCMWEPSEGRDPNGAPCRGFAGQILFLGNKGGAPVIVDGAVSVYVFDDLGTEEEQAVPIHQYNFDAGAWNRHMKVGSLGPAYHCFIPYTRAGGHEANCSVRLKLTPKEGQYITSDSSQIVLRGKSRKGDDQQMYAQRNSMAYETSRPQDAKAVRTTTIPLQQRESAPLNDSGVVPASYSPEDHARQVMEDYRREQSLQPASLDRRTSASSRIRWRQDAGLAATNSTTDSTRTDSIEEATVETAASTPARRHPLRDYGSQSITQVKAESLSSWEASSESAAEDLDGQTTDISP